MFEERTKLPTCEYGVCSQTESDYLHYGCEKPCGEPAIAKWNWGSGDFYVCEHHDEMVQEAEMLNAEINP